MERKMERRREEEGLMCILFMWVILICAIN
jgi:hypothetical protein